MSERHAVARLQRWVPTAVHEVMAALRAAGGEAVLVGGAVRDAFLGRRSHDWDIATNFVPSRVASLFPRVVRAGEKHGTIMVVTDGGVVEVTTYRRDGAYVDKRRPSSVEFHGNLEDDLARRDFTINALAVDLALGRVIDPFHGVADLHRGVVRCVGDPVARFSEDGLRLLRAVRFAGVLGFRLEAATRKAIPAAIASFAGVSWERKRDEMVRLLQRGRQFGPILGELTRSGLLELVAPELVGVAAVRLRALDQLPDDRPWLRFAAWAALAALPPQTATDVLQRWRVATAPTREVHSCLAALALLPRAAPPRGPALRRWLSRVTAPTGLMAARIAQVLWSPYAGFSQFVCGVLKRDPALQLERLAVRGDDLLAAGFEGRQIGLILQQLLTDVLDHPQHNRRPWLLALAHRISTAKT